LRVNSRAQLPQSRRSRTGTLATKSVRHSLSRGRAQQLAIGAVVPSRSMPVPALSIHVGVIVTAEPVAGKDKLTAIEVDIGDEEPVKIVTNAPNAKEGNRIVVATVGATVSSNCRLNVLSHPLFPSPLLTPNE